jgi:arginine decarboxylase
MNIRQIQESRELYGIDSWGDGYFSINDHGHVVCHPTAEEHLSIDLERAVEMAKAEGISSPMLLRFPQIIENQIQKLHTAFKNATSNYNYEGSHVAVFPFKVNQRREFIDNAVKCGFKHDYGLEVGSKTEFMAALSYHLSEKAHLICNGFKDREFIRLGFIGTAMGKKVIMVVEGPDELQMIIDEHKKDPSFCPQIGIRVKLYSRGSGKWVRSSGEYSKFGLTTLEVLKCLEMIKKANLQEKFTTLHFHIGSQITEIKRVKNAIKEASRVYAKVYKMGYKTKYLDIGGGIGVDYDGSKTSFESSANYSLAEFASDVIYQIGEVCKNEEVPCPDIITESGRTIAAYHSVVITDIREIQGTESMIPFDKLGLAITEDNHKSLQELKYIFEHINHKNFVEFYHDAIEYHEEMFTLFNLGYLSLEDRATAEQLFNRICQKALYFSSFDRHELEEFTELQARMVSKYLANFSIFQSIPDSWAIDQLFPVMPLTHMEQRPTTKATIVDITCDSDGCLDKFVDRHDIKHSLDLHAPAAGIPYYLGFFLIGAYQESLANEHNLFGAINEAEFTITPSGECFISKVTKGDPIKELLEARNYEMVEMKTSFEYQLKRARENGIIDAVKSQELFATIMDYFEQLPYLSEE